MRIISRQQAEAWCCQQEVLSSEGGLPDRSAFPIKFSIPNDAGARVNLVRWRMEAFREAPESLVWFNGWSVWPSGERMHIFDRFRKSYGDIRPLSETPARVFGADEIEDAISFVTIAVLFLWDCYVLTPKATRLLFFSHDEYGCTNLHVEV